MNHKGIDIGAAKGSSIYAVADGTVTVSGIVSGYGYYVQIQHANGVKSFYGHMRDASTLKVGDKVSAGDFIGYVGGTGTYDDGSINNNAYSPHLHFGVLLNGKDVDPMSGYFSQAAMSGLSYRVMFYTYK